MEPLYLSKTEFNSKVPLLGIKKAQNIRDLHEKPNPLYLSNDLLSDIILSNNANSQFNGCRVSNVWTNASRRERLKHLSDNPVCVCGAGNNLQFLHTNESCELRISDIEVVSDKERRRGKKQDDKSVIKVSEKLIPAEFDFVFHHGSNSIQLYDGKHGTQPQSHKQHNVSLPVMNPNKPSESRKIYNSLKKILEKSGLNEIFDPQLPTSLHRLLLLVKKEQDLYNLIFYGVIKQTTIDCIDRGELLANIRQRYRNIFISVPQKIKEFHDMVIAQQILDRRLTEELTRFQMTVSGLSNELNRVKNHEDSINRMCHDTKDKLKQAVEETKTNADLLREYHGLYELQRNRLEKCSTQLDSERDCWRGAAYVLTERVLGHYDIGTGITLVEAERKWLSLSTYFIDVLIKSDSQLLNMVTAKAALWYNEAQKFSLALRIRDDNVRSILEKEIEKINTLKEDFQYDYLTPEGQLIEPLGKDQTQKIFNSILAWEKTMSYLSELFGGQSMITEEEKLTSLKKLNMEYTDLAIEVFNRHRHESDNSLYEEHTTLLELNKTIEQMMNQFYDKLTGDNGVADGITTLQTYLENWIARLNNNLSDSFFRPLPDSEWIRLKIVMDDWIFLLLESKNAIGSVKPSIYHSEIKKKLEVMEVIQTVENWSHRSLTGIESENMKLHGTIINLQQSMIRWTGQIVIRLAPDFPNNSPEAKRAARMASVGIKELEERANLLHDNIKKHTAYIMNCCKGIITKLVQHKIDTQSEFPDEDNVKFLNLQESSKKWIDCSQEILKQMMDVEYTSQTREQDVKEVVEKMSSKELSQSSTAGDREEAESDDEFNVASLIGGLLETSMFHCDSGDDEQPIQLLEAPPTVQGVGVDSNVHSQILVQDPNQPYEGNKFKNSATADPTVHLPETEEAFMLMQISQFLEKRLKTNNKQALLSEQEYGNVELELARCKLHLSSLEERCSKVTKEIEELKTEKSLVLPIPALLTSSHTLEHQISQSTEKSGTPKSSVSSSRHRAPKHPKKKK